MTNALDDVSFEVEEGEFLVLLGPSGCGKSTLLRAIAGLERLDTGSIELGGVTVLDRAAKVDVPTERRRISMMFQSYALWPHMTIAQNVAYPLRARGVARADTAVRVRQALESAGIGELSEQYPGQVSGGQAQRVALARALVSRDGIILFDEPLSNVDAKVREQLRAEIARLHREFGFTAVYVTHDQEEALTLASRICVMRKGKIWQSGTPEEVYDRPNTAYVARFLGSVNEIPGRFDGDRAGGLALISTSVGQLPVEYLDGDEGVVTVFSRPESWRILSATDARSDAAIALKGIVEEVVFLGSFSDVRVAVGEAVITVRSMDRSVQIGQEVEIEVLRASLFAHPGIEEAPVDTTPVVPEETPVIVDRRSAVVL
ncbi:ABC transporter ATP-binding protein [Microbacterium pygmaeum]|uniref:ABC transporter ATP-binding protein n=1 Tax=Microbacterium pygmaeum TaxID=370764 RepID=UPI0018D2AEC0|nr:ABC transporter ATP-binding protein [Microbacterium pygmaeum]